jgi:hypothetical protein
MPRGVVTAVKQTQMARKLAMDYEANVLASLAALARAHDWSLLEHEGPPYDATIRDRNGDEVLIEIKWSQAQASLAQYARWMRQLKSLDAPSLLIVSSRPPGSTSDNSVQWNSVDDDRKLESALLSSLHARAVTPGEELPAP